MSFDLANLMPVADLVAALPANALWLVASAVFLVTAGYMALGLPGIVVPLSVASGAVLGPAYAGATVALGGLVGAQIFFFLSRRALKDRIDRKHGGAIDRIRGNFARYGFWYVVGLRVAGAPHFALTTACAVLPISGKSFGAATLLGLLPVALAAAAVGSSL